MKNALEEMKSVVASHPVVRHPFLKAFADGRLTLEQVRRWAEQQFYFSISLPSAFAALYARSDDRFWMEKRPLVGLIDVEAWATGESEAHSTFFIELAEFLGLNLHELTSRPPEVYTRAYIAIRLDLCLNRPIVQGLAAIALSNEILNLYVFPAYRQGIHKIEGLEKCPTGYFDAHIRDEESDFKVFQFLFDVVAQDESDLRLAETAVRELLDARMVFLDALSEDLGI